MRSLIMAAAGLVAFGSAQANVLNSADNGWYDDTGFHNPDNTNIFTGWISNGEQNEVRSFFVFDISALNAPVSSASFMTPASTNSGCPGRLSSTGCYESTDGAELIAFYGVDTPIQDLIDGVGGVSAYDDLGGGTRYGSDLVSAGFFDPMPEVGFSFQQTALNDLNAAIANNDQFFAIGAVLVELARGPNTEGIWSFSDATNFSAGRLMFETVEAPVPVPAALPLMAAGLGALGAAARRRRKA